MENRLSGVENRRRETISEITAVFQATLLVARTKEIEEEIVKRGQVEPRGFSDHFDSGS